MKMLASVFTVFNYGEVAAVIGTLGLALSDWIVLAASLVVMGIVDAKRSSLKERFRNFSPAAQTALICVAALAVMIFGMYGIGFNASEFIYSNF